MNLPSSKPFKTSLTLKQSTIQNSFSELITLKFTGYVALMNKSVKGLEEGILILKNGLITGCAYDFLNYNKTIYGDKALELFSNSCLNKEQLIDIYFLDLDQVDLVLAFNQAIKVNQINLDLLKLVQGLQNKNYLLDFSLNEISVKVESSKDDLLRKYGFSAIEN